MMDQKYLAEIKARCDEGRPTARIDVKALIAEVERLTDALADQTARANICEHDAKVFREDRDRLLADNAAKDQQIATLTRERDDARRQLDMYGGDGIVRGERRICGKPSGT